MRDELFKEMTNQNPWWVKSGFSFPEASWSHRAYFDRIINELPRRQIIGITGLRRIGKTTMIRQLISRLLAQSIDPLHIFYFSFDEALIARNPQILEEVIEGYIERILVTKVFDLSHTIYILFDEIQYIPLWQAVLKRFYDASRLIKFIVTGSASLFISQKGTESLAGRIIEIFVPPLSFREFMQLTNANLALPDARLRELLSNQAKVDPKWFVLYQENLNAFLSRFLFQGGFPEIIQEADENFVIEYLNQSVIARIVRFDLIRFFDIKREDVLLGLLKFAGGATGKLLDFQGLSKNLSANRETITNYFSYLKKSYLIDIVYNYTASVVKQLRTNKKVFVSHPNLTYALMGLSPTNPLIETMMGSLVETYVFNLLKTEFPNVNFWRDHDKEVDFVVVEGNEIIPVEVKFKRQIDHQDLRYLICFCKKNHLSQANVITKSDLSETTIDGIRIIMIPVTLL